MSWGDPFDKFYKDDDEDRRREVAVQRGFVPGVLISYGTLGSGKTLHVWDSPDLSDDSHPVAPGLGIIIAVDCESDPTADWLMILLNSPTRQMFGWLPTSLVKKVE